MERITTKVTYRVRPEHFGFAPEDFDTLEQALERCNYRNSVSIDNTFSNKERLYRGDNCKIQKVTTTIEEITY